MNFGAESGGYIGMFLGCSFLGLAAQLMKVIVALHKRDTQNLN